MLTTDERFETLDRRLDRTLSDLEALKKRQLDHLHHRMQQSNLAEALKLGQTRKKEEQIESIFSDFFDWAEGTMTPQNKPWIKLLCVMTVDE